VGLACVNCDGPLAGGLLYCSSRCEQEASYVRYVRHVLRDGRWRRPEVREAIRIRAVVVMNGGYPHAERAISGRYRELILARDQHTCQSCGGTGTQVDHIHLRGVNGNINHPRNLQTLCARCHRQKTLADIRLISHRDDPETWERLRKKGAELDRRVRAEAPERLSDDEQRWAVSWRAIQAERRAQLASGQQRPNPRSRHLWLVKS
jgi:5-methylcytosine-specific restriction endonuclease McrA